MDIVLICKFLWPHIIVPLSQKTVAADHSNVLLHDGDSYGGLCSAYVVANSSEGAGKSQKSHRLHLLLVV